MGARSRQDEMVLISSRAGKPQDRSMISLQQLDGMNFVTFSEDTPTRSAIEKFFRQAGIRVEIRFENENIETLKKAVEAGLGLAILPLKAIERDKENQRFSVIKIKGHSMKRPIGIIKPKNRALGQAADLFVSELMKREN